MKRNERKKVKKELKEIIEQITAWYGELKKLSPANIKADRIKSEINRLMNLYNDRQIILLSNKLFWIYVLFFILLAVFCTSFFVKPQIQFNLTFNFVISSIIIISVFTIITILLRHYLTKDDRKAKRKRDYAEAKYFESQVNKIK